MWTYLTYFIDFVSLLKLKVSVKEPNLMIYRDAIVFYQGEHS